MQWTRTIGTILKEGHIRIIPTKFGQNPASSLGGDVVWSNCWRQTIHDGRRTSNDHNSSPWANGPGELKCQEQNEDLYMIFVDLNKAFDTVSRDGLWKIMAKFGCPPRYIAMVRHLHDGTTCRHTFSMMESTLNHFRWLTESNKAVLWHQHCSACCFLLCSQMLFKTLMLVLQSGTAMMASYWA